MKQRILAPLEARLEIERVVQRLDDALHACEAALDDGAERPVLVGELAAGRQVDACDLEEPDAGVAGVEVVPGGLDEAREQPRAEHRLLARLRLRDAQGLRVRILGDEARRVRLVEPGAEQHVLDDAAQSLLLREPAEHLAPGGQRVRDLVEPDAADLLDEVDLAGHVPRAPGGNGHLRVAATSKPSRSRIACCSAGGVSRPSISSVRSRAQVRTGRRGQLAVDVRVARPARAGQVDEELGRKLGRRLREVRVDALLPATRRLGAQAQPLGGAKDPDRLEVGGLEQELARLLVDLALERAHDPGDRNRPLGVGDHEVVLVERAHGAVERGHLLALAARRTTMRPSASLARSKAWSGLPSASIT